MPVADPLYPLNLRVSGHRCLVVGAGAVAAQKVAGLVECDAQVVVVAPDVGAEVRAMSSQLELRERSYRATDLEGVRLVIAATGDPVVNHRVLSDGRAAGVLVNSADDPENCDFTLPARVRHGRLLLTVSTHGDSPAMATWIRRRLGEEFGPEYEILLELLAETRTDLRARGVSTEGLGWQDALDSGILEMVREDRVVEAKERLEACLSSSSE